MHERPLTSLESLLAETLAERAAGVPATVTLEHVHQRLAERQRATRKRSTRRSLTLLGLVAVLLLPVVAFIVAQRPSEPEPTDAGPFEALVRRVGGDDWVLAAVRGDGQERILATLPVPDPDDERRRPMMAVSDDGWLASPGLTEWEFRDLRSPDRVIDLGVPFRRPGGEHAWIGDGRFAEWNEDGEIVLQDPVAGTVERMRVSAPLTNVIAWTADGSAIVSHGDWGSSVVAGDERRPPDWRVSPLDGETSLAALADLELGWQSGVWWRPDGRRVQLCDLATARACPALPNGAVVVESADGATLTPWYTDEEAPDDVVDAALGTDAMWLLVARREGGRRLALARLEAPGLMDEVAQWPEAASSAAWSTVSAIAPDESLVVVAATDAMLVDAGSGRVTPLRGDFVGFMPSSSVGNWTEAPLMEAAPLPSSGAPPADTGMQPFEQMVAEQLTPADQELWRGEYLAPDDAGVTPTRVDIGPIMFDEGIGVLLACDGPSDVLITAEGDAGQETASSSFPLLSRCLIPGDLAGGYAAWVPVGGPLRLRLTATSDTSWRLLIFDPAPES